MTVRSEFSSKINETRRGMYVALHPMDPGAARAPRRLVGRVPPLRSVFFALAMLSMFPSCLILEDFDLPEEPNYPPSIVADRAVPDAPPLTEILELDRSDPLLTEVTFAVKVRDPNIDQQLEYQVYVDFQGSIEASLITMEETTVPISGTDERPLAFTISDLTRFTTGTCHKVELRVSSEFKRFPELRDPATDGDLAVAVWWVDPQVDGIGANLDTCP